MIEGEDEEIARRGKEEEDAGKIIAAAIESLEAAIVGKYPRHLAVAVQNMICKAEDKTIAQLGKKVCNIDFRALESACAEMKTDIRFLTERRGILMEKQYPSLGKIAGIIAFRLAKSHIIHLSEECASCKKPCAASKLNQEVALWYAYDYIGAKYLWVPEDRRRELFYSFSYRHVNQETLGLVFDAFWDAYVRGKQHPLD